MNNFAMPLRGVALATLQNEYAMYRGLYRSCWTDGLCALRSENFYGSNHTDSRDYYAEAHNHVHAMRRVKRQIDVLLATPAGRAFAGGGL